ncbi:unnamed protein product [Schistosoma margrebowiei]|uniref:Uncharacterized protein n=1 Tax=Schistosoma margrebowiei TaxID=48269 RepID=A0A183N6A2_9TREM|nr:unnamed protein product [Schistosoma margrebowiei]
MVAGDQQLVHTPFVPAGYWSPCAPLVWNPVKAPDIRFSSSHFREQHPRHEKTSCINHLLESGGRRAKRIYRTYMTAKHFCPAWLLNQNPIISTPRHTLSNEDQMNHYVSQPWTKIAESLTTVINDNVLDDDDDRTTATTQCSSINNQKEKCLLDEYSSDSDRHNRHLHSANDDGDSLEEPILTNRGSSPDSVAYSRLTEEENDINSVQNVQLTKHDQNNDDDDDDDEEEYDDDEDECELELATTLHQLTLDNALVSLRLNNRTLAQARPRLLL